DNPFWIAQVQGGEEAARRYGFELTVTSGQGDVSRQVQAFEDLVNQGVDVISLNPIDTQAFGPAMERAAAAGIPVVCLFSYVEGCVTVVGLDEVTIGRMVGEFAVQQLIEKNGAAEGEVAILQGMLGQDINQTRGGGFEEIIAEYPDITIVAAEPTNWDPLRASEITENWLTTYPDLDLIYGLSDSLTVPAANVIQRSGAAENVLLVSVDGTESGLDAVAQGLTRNTIALAPQYNGFWNVYVPYLVANGVAFPERYSMPGALVTSENVDALIQMADDLESQTATFPFELPLQAIVDGYVERAGA
ncbi:MAG: sugar ABC transporter substrate-binding protein, partial [Burkholderiales bacterium]|nr:sugar ABC transporter substrate-binding protein [Anaerolineae bacterium]